MEGVEADMAGRRAASLKGPGRSHRHATASEASCPILSYSDNRVESLSASSGSDMPALGWLNGELPAGRERISLSAASRSADWMHDLFASPLKLDQGPKRSFTN